MDINEIKKMLKAYNTNKALLESLVHEKDNKLEELKYANQEHTELEYDCIAALSLQAPVISDIPKSCTNKFSSVTENVMIAYEDELTHKNEFDVLSIKKKIDNIEKQIKKLREDKFKIDIMLKSLDVKDNFIINAKYIEGYTTNEVSLLYYERFKTIQYEEKALNKKTTEIISKMVEFENKRKLLCG